MQPGSSARLKRIQRRRLAERLILRAAAVCVLAWGASTMASARSAKPKLAPIHLSVTVQPGDTLWGIARRHTPPTEDVRTTLYRMGELNQLRGSLIQPGQLLKVSL